MCFSSDWVNYVDTDLANVLAFHVGEVYLKDCNIVESEAKPEGWKATLHINRQPESVDECNLYQWVLGRLADDTMAAIAYSYEDEHFIILTGQGH